MLDEYEPSSCRCRQCIDTCKTKPGILAPGDFWRICDYLDTFGTAFLRANFVQGEMLPCQMGTKTEPVPTIRPKQHDDGRCVFLTPDDRCSIQPVKPFGCSRCNACQPSNTLAIDACLNSIARSEEHLDLHIAIAHDEAAT